MRGRGASRGAIPFDSALQIDRENPFSVNTDWGIFAIGPNIGAAWQRYPAPFRNRFAAVVAAQCPR